MSKKQWGSFPEAFGSDDKLFTGGQLAKAVDPDDINLEGMCEALEVLNCRAKKMSKSQLHRLNYKLGLAVNKFRDEVQKYITRPRSPMNQGTLEKVQRGNGDMSDSGLDERRENVIPQVGTPHKFTKASGGGDMGDPFGDEEAK